MCLLPTYGKLWHDAAGVAVIDVRSEKQEEGRQHVSGMLRTCECFPGPFRLRSRGYCKAIVIADTET